MNKWDLFLECKIVSTYENVIYHINKVKEKKCMIKSTDAEHNLTSSTSFHIKTLKLGIEGNYLNIIKLRLSMIFYSKRLKVLPLRSGKKSSMLAFTTSTQQSI